MPNISSHDDRDLAAAGYTPQLKRAIRYVSSWAASFSMMSVLMGVFSNYGYVLNKAGAFGLWSWVLVGVGQLLVALVLAELGGRLSLAGAIYNWNTKLANPMMGWITGCLTVCTYAIASVGVIMATMTPLQSLTGLTFEHGQIMALGAALFLLGGLINVIGIRFAALLNQGAVLLEILALLLFGGILAALIASRIQLRNA